MSFSNKVILITGASSGIGAHVAEHLAKKGGSVAIVGRNEKRLNEVSERIKMAGAPTPLVILADVTTDAVQIINETINHFGKLNILINNAGIASYNTIETVDLAEFDRLMNTNVRSIIQLTQLAIPHLEKTKGNILNVSSTAGMRVKPNLMAYCMTKSAVDIMTKSAALDLAPKGIRVNSINPVNIRTGIHETGFHMTPEQAAKFYEDFKYIYPVGRVGECSDTSAAIEFLVSDSASFITGMLMPVDGGALTAGK